MIRVLVIAICLTVAPLLASAQFGAYDHVRISQKHSDKLAKITSPEKKLARYHKYYSKDSIKLVRNLDRYWKQKSDSLTKAAGDRRQKLESRKADILSRASRAKSSISINDDSYKMSPGVEIRFSKASLARIYACLREIQFEMSKDTLGFNFARANKFKPSVPQVQSRLNVGNAKRRLPGRLPMFKRPNPSDNPAVKHALAMQSKTMEYHDQVRKYKAYSELNADSLKGMGSEKFEQAAMQRISSLADFKSQQSEMAKLNELTAMRDQYKGQMETMSDSTRRIEMAKSKASEAALKLAGKNGSLKTAQRKMSMLMRKYSAVSNSNDLSTAVKKTSLQGKSFGEHLLLAANFQVLGLNPVSFDFSPQIGYKFNTRFALGVGGTYRQTIKDSIPTLSPTVFGYKVFSSFTAYQSFFVYGEYDRNSPGVIRQENVAKRIWKPAALLGIGRTFSVHRKVDMTVTALYNFLYEYGDPVYPRPFIVRFGFQLSELALLKRKPTVKIN